MHAIGKTQLDTKNKLGRESWLIRVFTEVQNEKSTKRNSHDKQDLSDFASFIVDING